MNLKLREAVAVEIMKVLGRYTAKVEDGELYGNEPEKRAGEDYYRWLHKPVPHYETDIRHAWEVVEKMAELLDGAPWLDRDESLGCDLAELLAMSAEEAAEAICLRALAAVRAKEPS